MRKAAAVIAALGIPLAARAAAPVPYVPVPRGGAVILDTGSTNTLGYRISIGPKGQAWFVVSGHPMQRASISQTLADKFFTNLRAAAPLSKLAVEQCMKSASFGTSLFVWWHGQRSPDLTCPSSDVRARAVYDDATQIATALHLTAGLHFRTLPTNEPRRIPSAPAVTPTPKP